MRTLSISSLECNGKATKKCLVNIVLAGHGGMGHLIVVDRKLTSDTCTWYSDWLVVHTIVDIMEGGKQLLYAKIFTQEMLDVVFCDSYNVLQLPHMGCDGPKYSSVWGE